MEQDMVAFKKEYPVKIYFLIGISLIITIGTIVATILMLNLGDIFSQLQPYSYLGLFLVALITGSPLLVPTFCWLLVVTLGSILNPALVGLISGLGVAIGSMLVYWSGPGGYQLLAIFKVNNFVRRAYFKTADGFLKKTIIVKVIHFVNRHAATSIFFMNVLPNPFQFPALLTLGARRVSFWKVFLACWSGRTVFYMFLAYLGYFSLSYLR
jgi:membrane protein YqaA with SNARE-associated domain